LNRDTGSSNEFETKQEEKPAKSKSMKVKTKNNEQWDSPNMKGYFSDIGPQFRSKRRSPDVG